MQLQPPKPGFFPECPSSLKWLGFFWIPIKAALFHNSHRGRIMGKSPGFWLCADTLKQSSQCQGRTCPQAQLCHLSQPLWFTWWKWSATLKHSMGRAQRELVTFNETEILCNWTSLLIPFWFHKLALLEARIYGLDRSLFQWASLDIS